VLHNFFNHANMDGTSSITGQKKNSSGSPAGFCQLLSRKHGSLSAQGLQIINVLDIVSGSDEAFGLFLLKNYKSLPTGSKNQVSCMPGLNMQWNQNLLEMEDNDKEDDGEMEMGSETDAVNAAKSC